MIMTFFSKVLLCSRQKQTPTPNQENNLGEIIFTEIIMLVWCFSLEHSSDNNSLLSR